MINLFNIRFIYQYMAATTGSFSMLCSGINIGWTSPYLPQILNGTYPAISMTGDEGSWCAVMPLVGAPLGALIVSALVDRFGRKYTILIMAPMAAFGFILLGLANTVLLVYLARFILGSVEGSLYVVVPMYLGEISEPSVRGIITASMGFYVILGTLFINVIGVYYSIFVSSLMCAAVPLVHFVTFAFMPESPYYFMKKGNYQQAENSLKTLRGNVDVSEEMKEIREAVYRQETQENPKITDLFTVKSNRRGLIIFCILNLTRKFSGKNPFMFYTTTIFQSADATLDPTLSVIIFICIEALAAIFSLVLLDRYGRRPIVIISTVGCAIGLCFCGLYFFLKDLSLTYVAKLGSLPLLALTLYNVFYTLGLELAPMIYLGELFPINIKAVALSLADTFSCLNSLIAAKIFQILADKWGMFLPFWSFCGCCLVGLAFIIKYVPETKNKTLEEIQLYLIKKTSEKAA